MRIAFVVSWKDEAILRLRHKKFLTACHLFGGRKRFSTSFSFGNRKRFRRLPFDVFFTFVFEKRFQRLFQVERKSFRRSFRFLKTEDFNVVHSHQSKRVFDVVFILEPEKRSTLKTLTEKLYRRFHRLTGDQNISEERQSLRRQTSININGVNGTKLLLHVKPHKIVGTICNNNNVFIPEKPEVNCVTRFVWQDVRTYNLNFLLLLFGLLFILFGIMTSEEDKTSTNLAVENLKLQLNESYRCAEKLM